MCVCVCLGGGVSLAAVSVLMERERVLAESCVSAAWTWDIALQKCIMANVQKSPPTLPNPPLLLLCLPGLSSSFVSEHREHRVPLDSHWKTTLNCCIESHCPSFTRFHLIRTTMLMVWNVWHCSSLVIIAVYMIKYEPFAAFRVVTMHEAYLHSDKNWHDDLQKWHDFDWTEGAWITSF